MLVKFFNRLPPPGKNPGDAHGGDCVLLYTKIAVVLYCIRVIRQCHKYDPTTGRWRECATLKKGRCCHDATAFNNRIFVSGSKTPSFNFPYSSCPCPYSLAVKGKANKRGNTVIALFLRQVARHNLARCCLLWNRTNLSRMSGTERNHYSTREKTTHASPRKTPSISWEDSQKVNLSPTIFGNLS